MVKKQAHEAIVDAIKESAASIENQKARIKSIKKHTAKLNKVLESMSLILSGSDTKNYIYVYGYDDEFTVALTLRQLDGFKCPALLAVLDYCDGLADAGSIKTNDWAESLNREFRFKVKPEFGLALTIAVNAYVRSDSATCRKIEVGTRMEEVKKYEIQCD